MIRHKILILSAGFGDGHNSAARSLCEALTEIAEPCIFDPCAVGAPRLNGFVQRAYRHIITYHPKFWHRIYLSTEKKDFTKPSFLTGKPERALAEKITQFKPDIIVSTYPLYPYFLERLFRKRPPIPVVTVVTDSIEINAAWRKAPSDYWLVTDSHTRKNLPDLPQEKIIDNGFPITPRFETLTPLPSEASIDPFHVLYFPTSKKPHVRRFMKAILEASPETTVTVVLGRNVKSLYRRTREIKNQYPGRVRMLGWTQKVPELLCSHHLVVGKAGGATVHETLAACCPMLVHHLVPGQEEGNLNLLKRIGSGKLTETCETLQIAIRELLANDGACWRKQKRLLQKTSRPAAAKNAAAFILALAQKGDCS